MSAVDELRAAATKLRTLATTATPGPWCFAIARAINGGAS